MLGNESFSANYYIKKSSNYLVNPNNLLLSLSLSLSYRARFKYLFFLSRIRARGPPRESLQTKGLTEFPLFSNSCLFVKPTKGI